jgi:hypothetical protein
MGLAVIIAVFALPVLVAWLVLRKRDRATSDDNYGGPEDDAPLNPLGLRQYTVTGVTHLADPPPGYTDPDLPRD